MLFKTAWWEINQIVCFCKLWVPGHLMGMAALQKSVGADFFETWGRRVDSVLCPFFCFVLLFLRGKGSLILVY